jgi:hypothetical protein
LKKLKSEKIRRYDGQEQPTKPLTKLMKRYRQWRDNEDRHDNNSNNGREQQQHRSYSTQRDRVYYSVYKRTMRSIYGTAASQQQEEDEQASQSTAPPRRNNKKKKNKRRNHSNNSVASVYYDMNNSPQRCRVTTTKDRSDEVMEIFENVKPITVHATLAMNEAQWLEDTY